jgi:YesN/AraC family two-component response regulator
METISAPSPSFSILLVDDDKDTEKLLTSILLMKFPAIVLHTAVNGRKGLELFKKQMPDVVITDVNMPGMDGVQMVGKIRLIKPGVKIIVLSAVTGKTTLENAVHILKPVDFRELFGAIDQCLAEIAQQPVDC